MQLRSALMALMMFLILPLGALNAWLPAMADSAPALHQTAAQSKVQTPRTCRSAFLPGASCAKFLDLAAQPESRHTAQRGMAFAAGAHLAGAGSSCPTQRTTSDGVTWHRRATRQTL